MNLNKLKNTFYHILKPLKVEIKKDRYGDLLGYVGKEQEENTCAPKNEACAMDNFFKEQAKLPSSLRSAGAHLVCYCRRCRSHHGTL